VLSGSATLRHDGETVRIEAGDYVAFPADESGAHRVVNEGDDSVRYLAMSTMTEPDVTVYPDSETFGVFVGSPRRAVARSDRCRDTIGSTTPSTTGGCSRPTESSRSAAVVRRLGLNLPLAEVRPKRVDVFVSRAGVQGDDRVVGTELPDSASANAPRRRPRRSRRPPAPPPERLRSRRRGSRGRSSPPRHPSDSRIASRDERARSRVGIAIPLQAVSTSSSGTGSWRSAPASYASTTGAQPAACAAYIGTSSSVHPNSRTSWAALCIPTRPTPRRWGRRRRRAPPSRAVRAALTPSSSFPRGGTASRTSLPSTSRGVRPSRRRTPARRRRSASCRRSDPSRWIGAVDLGHRLLGEPARDGRYTCASRSARAAYAAAACPALPALFSAMSAAPCWRAAVIASDCPRSLNVPVGFAPSF